VTSLFDSPIRWAKAVRSAYIRLAKNSSDVAEPFALGPSPKFPLCELAHRKANDLVQGAVAVDHATDNESVGQACCH